MGQASFLHIGPARRATGSPRAIRRAYHAWRVMRPDLQGGPGSARSSLTCLTG